MPASRSREDHTARAVRVDARWPLTLVDGRSRRPLGTTDNVSVSGMRFRSAIPIRAGGVVFAEILIPGRARISVAARVLRREALSDGQYVYGARFAKVSDEGKRHIGDAILAIRRATQSADYGFGRAA